jgi:hypothetical protein
VWKAELLLNASGFARYELSLFLRLFALVEEILCRQRLTCFAVLCRTSLSSLLLLKEQCECFRLSNDCTASTER